MWYKCYCQSSGEGIGEMQESNEESKNRVGSHCSFPSFLFSTPFPPSFSVLYAFPFLFTQRLCSTYHQCADCFSRAKSNQTLEYFDEWKSSEPYDVYEQVASERLGNVAGFKECEMPCWPLRSHQMNVVRNRDHTYLCLLVHLRKSLVSLGHERAEDKLRFNG